MDFITELKLKDKNKRKMEIKQEIYKSGRETRELDGGILDR